MTSKEALKYLLADSEELYNQYEEDEKFYLDAVELYNIVLKDLEILDILKKYVYFSSKSNCVRMKDIYKRTTNFDYETLKEWLENGRGGC